MSRFDGRRFAFASCGDDVTIYEWVRIVREGTVSVGSHVIVDDFVFLDGGRRLSIGSYVHVAGFSSIIGAGVCELADFATLSWGVRIVTGTEIIDGSGLTNSTIPPDMREVHRGRVRIGSHALVASNAVVHPDVEVGEGTVVGSGSVVTRDLPPWTICVGSPARPIRDRPSERILELEQELRARDPAAFRS
jgi:galactoside O-acetyltransferase